MMLATSRTQCVPLLRLEKDRDLDPDRHDLVAVLCRREAHHLRNRQGGLVQRRLAARRRHKSAAHRTLLVDVEPDYDGTANARVPQQARVGSDESTGGGVPVDQLGPDGDGRAYRSDRCVLHWRGHHRWWLHTRALAYPP